MVIGCIRGNNGDLMKITIHSADLKVGEVKLYTVNVLSLESSVIAEAKVDSAGASFTSLDISRPLFGNIEIGEKGAQVLLSPNYDLHIYIDKKSSNAPIRFKGKGSEANNYLAQAFLIQDRFERSGGKDFFELEPQAFLARLDSMKVALSDFHRNYTDSIALPEDISTLLEGKSKLKVLYLKQNYALSNFDDGLPTAPSMKSEFKNVAAEVPLDTTYLNSGMFEYAFSLHMYMDSKFYGPLASVALPQVSERAKDYFLIGADKLINQNEYAADIKAFFIAENIHRSMGSIGITPGITTIFTDFKKESANSAYLPTLEKMFNQWLAISAGKVAPEIAGVKPDGTKLKLSDLKGKVVYIDVWATWCVPCLKEMPYAKKLLKQFEKNNQVVFLYVSVDENKQAWAKMVAADKEFKGIHILDQSEGKTTSIWDAYLIKDRGIPCYMLIDQEGNIVQVDAARPSSREIKGQIEEILKKDKEATL